jgi:hypothetical protein
VTWFEQILPYRVLRRKLLRSSDANLRLFGLVGINRAHSDETFHVLQ